MRFGQNSLILSTQRIRGFPGAKHDQYMHFYGLRSFVGVSVRFTLFRTLVRTLILTLRHTLIHTLIRTLIRSLLRARLRTQIQIVARACTRQIRPPVCTRQIRTLIRGVLFKQKGPRRTLHALNTNCVSTLRESPLIVAGSNTHSNTNLKDIHFALYYRVLRIQIRSLARACTRSNVHCVRLCVNRPSVADLSNSKVYPPREGRCSYPTNFWIVRLLFRWCTSIVFLLVLLAAGAREKLRESRAFQIRGQRGEHLQ